MNLLLFEAGERDGAGLLRIRGPRLAHIREVHGKQAGDRIRVGEIGGLIGEADILACDEREAVLAPQLQFPPPEKLPVILVLALPRPKMLRRVLRSAAEMGVAELHLVNTWRVEKSYWQTPVLAPATLREYLLQGLEQSRDTMLPSVHLQRRFKPFVEDQLPALLQGRRGIVAHPGNHPPCPRGIEGEALLAIGPEGGFIPYEIDLLGKAGCEAVSLGPRILRVENAVTALLARLF
ncbi:16S rRNA (uracil(1498)-N(3))-methyltransferase [Haliea sp. E17]|uniref:16S rRNA (uracil(1498)-N(3))-methyltransferase n=1 Tax=Haliea sp. E17 TaxID=3401576 RepID=UPI003AAC2841